MDVPRKLTPTPPAPTTAFLDLLTDTLGPGAVVVGHPTVVRPASTTEVAAAVRACAEHGVAMVPRGGDTGLSGGTQMPATRAAVVLSLDRLRTIESVDPERWTITAQAGVTIEALQEAAAAVDRKFAPDWGARGTATIGGAIATDAGGNNVVRYGNLRDNVMGLEVVLADGRIWDGRRALRKDSSGYDLKQLFIGAEGTLGVVTSAVLKLVPATPHEQSALAAITDLDALMALYALAHVHAPAILTAFELIPEVAIERVQRRYGVGHPIETRADHYMLVKLASSEPVTDRLTALLAAADDAGLITDAVVAATPEQESALWFLRDEIPPTRAFPEHHAHGVKLDTAVPIDHICAFITRVHSLAARITPDALCYGFGHVGDGNIHMMILPTSDDHIPAFADARPELRRAIDALVFELGGTLSAEHGLGTLLRDRVEPQKPAIEWELMRTIKRSLDPDDLFNPEKTLPLPS
ncbi:MAG: FAD-binding oxidoreductase [Acidimicrobiales bacterium]